MSDRDLLLRAILANPEEDTPRLAFADWCDENNYPQRAEFIRASLAEEKLKHTHAPGAGGCRRCKAARAVCRYIETRGDREWATGAVWYGGRGLVWDGGALEYRRGFVSKIRLPAAAFLQHAESIFRAHPVTTVVLTDKRPDPDVHTMPSWTWWLIGGDGHPDQESDGVPRELFDRLATWACIDCGDLRKSFTKSEQEARDALSDACVAYGRELAGLPPLTPPPSPVPPPA